MVLNQKPAGATCLHLSFTLPYHLALSTLAFDHCLSIPSLPFPYFSFPPRLTAFPYKEVRFYGPGTTNKDQWRSATSVCGFTPHLPTPSSSLPHSTFHQTRDPLMWIR